MQDIDLIILGGFYGEGRYTGIIKTFMMGVAVPTTNEKENPSKFFSVVSVSTGMDDKTLHDFQKKFAPYWIKKCPEKIVGPKVNIYIHLFFSLFFSSSSEFFNISF